MFNSTHYLTHLVQSKERKKESNSPLIFMGKIAPSSTLLDHGNTMLTNTGYAVEVLDYVNPDGTPFIVGGCYLLNKSAPMNGFGDRTPLTKGTPVICASLRSDYRDVIILGAFKAYGDLAKYFQQGLVDSPNNENQKKRTNTAAYSIYPPLVALPNSDSYTHPKYSPEFQTDGTMEELGKNGPGLGGLSLVNNFNGDRLEYTVGKQIYYADEDLVLVSGITGKNKCDSFREASVFYSDYAKALRRAFKGETVEEQKEKESDDAEKEPTNDPLLDKEDTTKSKKETTEAKETNNKTPIVKAKDNKTNNSTYSTTNSDKASEVSLKVGIDSETLMTRFVKGSINFNEWAVIDYHIEELEELSKSYIEMAEQCEINNVSLSNSLSDQFNSLCVVEPKEETTPPKIIEYKVHNKTIKISDKMKDDLDKVVKEIPSLTLSNGEIKPKIEILAGYLEGKKELIEFKNKFIKDIQNLNSYSLNDAPAAVSLLAKDEKEYSTGLILLASSIAARKGTSLEYIKSFEKTFNKYNFKVVYPEDKWGGIVKLKYSNIKEEKNDSVMCNNPNQSNLLIGAVDLGQGGAGIIQAPASTSNMRFNRKSKIKRIVLHNTLGTIQGTIATFKNPSAEVSAHYTIDRTGAIYQHVQDKDVAWHAPGANEDGLGIEIVAYDSQPYMTKIQEATLIAFVKQKMAQYGVPKSGIFGHREISSTSCPNRIWLFPDTPSQLKVNHPHGTIRSWIARTF